MGMLLSIQDFDYFMASLRLDELRKYLGVTDKYLRKAKEDFKAWADGEAKTLPPQQQQEFYEFYSDEYWRHEEKFPRILRNSFLVSAHSLLEYELNVICEKLRKDQEIAVSLSNFRGDELERVKLFFKNAGLSLDYNSPTWQEINNYYLVRNSIVHNSGLIKGFKREKDLRTYITQKKIISQDTIQEEVALTEQFCEEVINTMQSFLDEVYKVYITHKERVKSM